MVVGGPSSNIRPSLDRAKLRNNAAADRHAGLVASAATASPSIPPMVGATAGHLTTDSRKHRLKSRFQVVKKLGQGTYGKVQLAVNKETGQQVAIKTIKKSKIESEQDLVRIRREIQIMSSIQHPHIIHIFEVFENNDKIVLVMQYASGGELYEYVSARNVLSDQDARRLFRQIATAIYYCHKNKVCHRDLKLENILLDEKGNAKIGDFGLSNVFDERHHLTTFCGSPLYASPEIVKGTPYLGPEVDCWSMGVLLYTLVYGAMPFDGSNFKRLVKQISEANYFEPKNRSEASPLIRRLLAVNPKKRATIIDICADPWVNSGFDTTLLTLAEDMANLTPVRLDILLELAPASSKDTPVSTVPTQAPSTPQSSQVEKPPGRNKCDSMKNTDAKSSQRSVGRPTSQLKHQQKRVSTSSMEMASSAEFIPMPISIASEVNTASTLECMESDKCTDVSLGATGKRPQSRARDSPSKLSSNSSKRAKSLLQVDDVLEKASIAPSNGAQIDSPRDDTTTTVTSTASAAAPGPHISSPAGKDLQSKMIQGPSKPVAEVKPEQRLQLQSQAGQASASNETTTGTPDGEKTAGAVTCMTNEDNKSIKQITATVAVSSNCTGADNTSASVCTSSTDSPTHTLREKRKICIGQLDKKVTDDLVASLGGTVTSSPGTPDSTAAAASTDTHQVKAAATTTTTTCSTNVTTCSTIPGKSSEQLKQEIEQKIARANESKQQTQCYASVPSEDSPVDVNSVTPSQITPSHANCSKPTLQVSAVKSVDQFKANESDVNRVKDTFSNGNDSQMNSSESFGDETDVTRRSPLKSSQSLANGQSKHGTAEKRSVSVTPTAAKRVGRLSIPSFLEIQDKSLTPKKPVPSYGSVLETKKKLLERKESIHSETSNEIERIFPTIPVKEAKTHVERRSSLAHPTPTLQKGPNAVRLGDNELVNESTNRTDKKVAARRSTEPISRQSETSTSPHSTHDDTGKTTLVNDNEVPAVSDTTPVGDVSPAVTFSSSQPAPITRSYKKVTFTKDGACITETGKVFSQEGPDGTVTRIEHKSKITHYPPTVETMPSPRSAESASFNSLDDVNPSKNHSRGNLSNTAVTPRTSNSSGIKKSESASSSGSTDVFDDIFDTWTSDSAMAFARKSSHRNRSSGEGNTSRQTRAESLERSLIDKNDLLLSPSIEQALALCDGESPYGPLFRGLSHVSPNMRSLIEKHKSMLARSFEPTFESTLRSPFNQSDASRDDSVASSVIRTPLASTFTEKKNPTCNEHSSSSSSGNGVLNEASVSVGQMTSPPVRSSRPEEVESEDSVASRRRVEQWLDTSPDTEVTERAGASESSSIYATIRPQGVSRYTRTLSSCVYDDADGSTSENVIGSVPNAEGKRPVVQMRLTLTPGGVSTGSRIVYSASPSTSTATSSHGTPVTSTSAYNHSHERVGPESSLLEQLRTHGYKNLVSQRLSGLQKSPAPLSDNSPHKKAPATAESNCTPTNPLNHTHKHHPLSAWIKSGHKLRQNNQSKMSQSTYQPSSLPCFTMTPSESTNYPPSHTPSKCMNRKRIDQMTDHEIKHLIHLTIHKQNLINNEKRINHSDIVNSNLNCMQYPSLPEEPNNYSPPYSRVNSFEDDSNACHSLQPHHRPIESNNSSNSKTTSNLSHTITNRQLSNELFTHDTKYSNIDSTVNSTGDQSESIDDNYFQRKDTRRADKQAYSLDCTAINNQIKNNLGPVDLNEQNSQLDTSSNPQVHLTGRSDSPSLEQLIALHRNTGVTVRPKVWPRVRKEPLFAPLWETQSIRDSPISDSFIMVRSPGPSTVRAVVNETSPFSQHTLSPSSPTAAASADAKTSTTSRDEENGVYETNYSNSNSNETCMSSGNDLGDTGICVTSPTTTNSSSVSPSLEMSPSSPTPPNASRHVYSTSGDANSNCDSIARSSIDLQGRLTSRHATSSSADRQRRINQRPSALFDTTDKLQSTLNSLSLDDEHFAVQSNGDTLNSHTDGNRDSPLTSNSSSVDDKYTRASYLDDFKLPPKPPSTLYSSNATSSGNEESVRERIHRKSFYRRFNDDTAHNSPRFKSASPARRRSSLLDAEEYSQVMSNGGGGARRSFSHNPSPSPTPCSSSNRRSMYSQSTSGDRRDSSSSAERFARMETRANQMLSEMRNQIIDVKDPTTSNGDLRRRSSSLLRNTSRAPPSTRATTSYYTAADDSDTDDDDDDYFVSRPVNYPPGRATASAATASSNVNYKSNESFFSSPPIFSSLFFAN